MPALFPPGGDAPEGPVAVAAGATLETVPVVVTAAGGPGQVVTLAPGELAAAASTTSTTTSTTVVPAPPPAPTTTETTRPAAPEPRPTATTTTTAPPAPTTTAPPPPPTEAAPEETTSEGSERTESGKASWYDHRPGICAHKTLPFGTVVTVTHTGNGKSTTCTVGDRGPYIEGWIIDLHPEQFEQLAPRSVGVIPVRISW